MFQTNWRLIRFSPVPVLTTYGLLGVYKHHILTYVKPIDVITSDGISHDSINKKKVAADEILRMKVDKIIPLHTINSSGVKASSYSKALRIRYRTW